MPLSTTNLTNFNEKFDIKLDDISHIECCSLQKIHYSFIESKLIVKGKKYKITNEKLKRKITEKFNWFFLK